MPVAENDEKMKDFVRNYIDRSSLYEVILSNTSIGPLDRSNTDIGPLSRVII